MLQKYGFEAEFDTDGFLENYEKVWNELYKEIAALYEDNELTEEESKLEEEFNVKLEELEGALEDYENSLKELADDIEKSLLHDCGAIRRILISSINTTKANME